jgi:hypothetical protein
MNLFFNKSLFEFEDNPILNSTYIIDRVRKRDFGKVYDFSKDTVIMDRIALVFVLVGAST